MNRSVNGWLVSVLACGALLSSCLSNTFDTPQKLGGKWVTTQQLNLGHDTYMNYCMQCHGVEGKGNGPAAPGANPQPRDFTAGKFKFQSTALGDLPTDDDLKRTIRYGLRGTPMLPWDISDERLDAVVQYIKTFSPVWKDKAPGTAVAVSTDPWGPDHAADAITQGRKVYHGVAQCFSCHPSYATLPEIDVMAKEMTGNGVQTLRDHPELSIVQDSEYGHKFMPPDFTKIQIKTGGEVADLYRVIGVGVNGTAMPSWKGLLSPKGDEVESEKNLWAVAYYVNSLHQLKYKPEDRKQLMARLRAANYGKK